MSLEINFGLLLQRWLAILGPLHFSMNFRPSCQFLLNTWTSLNFSSLSLILFPSLRLSPLQHSALKLQLPRSPWTPGSALALPGLALPVLWPAHALTAESWAVTGLAACLFHLGVRCASLLDVQCLQHCCFIYFAHFKNCFRPESKSDSGYSILVSHGSLNFNF